jgi:hypothetical protein
MYAIVGVSVATNLVRSVCFSVRDPPPSLEETHSAYLAAEGHQRRGSRFQQLAMMIAFSRPWKDGARTASMSEAIGLLGPPDMVQRRGVRESVLYFYDRNGSKDWAVILSDGGDGSITLGFADRSSFHVGSDWEPYKGERETEKGTGVISR